MSHSPTPDIGHTTSPLLSSSTTRSVAPISALKLSLHPSEALDTNPNDPCLSNAPITPRSIIRRSSSQCETLKPDRSSTASSGSGPHSVPHSLASDSGRLSTRTPRALIDFLVGFDHDFFGDIPFEDVWSVATKRRGVYNIVQVPMCLERLLFFGQALCLYDFLTIFTFLPLRLIIALLHLIYGILSLPLRCIRHRVYSDIEHQKWSRTLVTYAIDILHMSLLILSVITLNAFDTSRIYHGIRGQSVIKIYVVFNMIEIFDRLCASFGVDVLDSLGWTTASAVTFFTRQKPTSNLSSSKGALHGFILLARVAIDYIFALAYVIAHGTLLLTWVVTLNVAINSQNSALLTLLVSNNFVELKGSAFKSLKIPNVFQIACSDAVERFVLTVFLAVMLVVSDGDRRLFVTWGIIYACEIIVDWIKHAFVLKFNRISHRVYRQFGMVICEHLVRTRTHSVARSLGGSAVTKRIGFVSVPLAALVARMVLETVVKLPLNMICIIWLVLLGLKGFLSICLIGHAWRRLSKGNEGGAEESQDRDEEWFRQLLHVERYDLVGK